jgi:hypothetical protein
LSTFQDVETRGQKEKVEAVAPGIFKDIVWMD